MGEGRDVTVNLGYILFTLVCNSLTVEFIHFRLIEFFLNKFLSKWRMSLVLAHAGLDLNVSDILLILYSVAAKKGLVL